jgi:hypothetical protein
MNKKEMLRAAEENSLNYCMQRGIAKTAFIDGAIWAMKYCREILAKAKSSLDIESAELECSETIKNS